jgi:hypothetical protein
MAEKNEKTKIVFGLIAIIGIMILSYILFPSGYRKTPVSIEKTSNLEEYSEENDKSEKIEVGSSVIEEETDSYIINVQYPVINGLQNEQIQVGLNENIRNFINEYTNDFKAGTEEAEIFEEMKSGFYIEFQTNYLSEKFASIKFNGSEYYSGAAHPNNYILSFNYNIPEDKEILLKDLFLPETNYLSVLSDISRKILFERFDEDLGVMQGWIEQGTEAEEGNFQNFGFTKNSLIIYFNSYQIGPGAIGIQETEIPFENLGKDIDLGIIDSLII